jgi:hypothetical protein
MKARKGHDAGETDRELGEQDGADKRRRHRADHGPVEQKKAPGRVGIIRQVCGLCVHAGNLPRLRLKGSESRRGKRAIALDYP